MYNVGVNGEKEGIKERANEMGKLIIHKTVNTKWKSVYISTQKKQFERSI